jgi:nucleotide-binding universal stress UspA family protein
MAKKFLVALDKSNSSLKAIDFVAGTINPSAQITLMSVVADPAAACELKGPTELHPLLEEGLKDFCVIEEAKRAAAQGFLDEAKNKLVGAGFPAEHICVELRSQEGDIAGDILIEAARENYDAVIIGRRGMADNKKYAFGSVSNKIIQHAENLSIIVVD